MKKKILLNLLLTFILSLLLTGLFYSIWIPFQKRGYSEVPLPIIYIYVFGDFLANLFLAIASLPILFLTESTICNNYLKRIICYFSGPVLLILFFVFFFAHNTEDEIDFLLPGLSFAAIHLYFYFRLMQSINKKAADI